MEGVSRIFYEWDLNRPVPMRRDSKQFLREIPLDSFFDFLNFVLAEVTTKDGCDANLRVCLAKNHIIRELISQDYSGRNFGALVFPTLGEIEEYVLNPNSNFFSNMHQNPEVGIISELYMSLNKSIRKDTVYFGRKGRRGEYIPNMIEGAVLLKKDIKEYEWFKELVDYPASYTAY